MDKYVVSARKYRPATFASVVGQRHVTSTLKNAIARNQLAHAYLFCGPRGVGKTTCARIFAKAINCLAPADNEACNECESCRSFNDGRSFNIHELDAASNNSVDDIRSLIDQVRIPPQVGRYSVFIIDEVHMLSTQAFNAFLKTLEEPPAHAIFILATTEKHKIIPTILSRCQIFDFNRIRVEDTVDYLKYIASQEGVESDDESLHLIARKADGGMRDALSMFDKAVSFCGSRLDFREVAQTLNILDYDTYFNVTSIILRGDYPAALLLFDEVLRKGFSGPIFTAGLNSHLRDLLVCKDPSTQQLLEVTGTLQERYRKQASECDVGFLFDAIALLTALDGTLRTASNQRLNVELGLMKLCGLGQKKNSPGSSSPALPPLVRGGAAASPAAEQTSAAAPRAAAAPATPTAQTTTQTTTQQPAAQAVPGVQTTPATQTATPAAKSATPAAPQEAPAASSAPTTAQTTPAAQAATPAATAAQVAAAAEHSAPAAPKREAATPRAGAQGSTPRAGVASILGPSIAEIMNGRKGSAPEESADSAPPRPEESDPDAESKIKASGEEFLRRLNGDRPRLAHVFSHMEVSGNRVTVKVPSEELADEIRRNATEVTGLLADTARVRGRIELDIRIAETPQALRPVKVEDRLRFLTEKNPELNNLRRLLDLELE